MHTLSTVLSAFFALLSTALAFIAYTHAQRAARTAGKLNGMSGRVIALEGALESLRLQHQKLAGKFHAAQREQDSDTPPATAADVGTAPAGVRKPATLFTDLPPYCDNYRMAQLEGPRSAASRCDCNYCAEMRFRRDQLKLNLMPVAREATLGTPRTRE